MRLRTGRKVGRTLYIQHGDEPSDADPLIGVMDEKHIAAQVVTAWNRHNADYDGALIEAAGGVDPDPMTAIRRLVDERDDAVRDLDMTLELERGVGPS